MLLDKYAELKIASTVLGFTIRDFANEQETYPQVIRDVCENKTTSARLTKAINQKITKAERKFDLHRKQKHSGLPLEA